MKMKKERARRGSALPSSPIEEKDAPGGARTPNQWVRNPLLFLLSYGRVAYAQDYGRSPTPPEYYFPSKILGAAGFEPRTSASQNRPGIFTPCYLSSYPLFLELVKSERLPSRFMHFRLI